MQANILKNHPLIGYVVVKFETCPSDKTSGFKILETNQTFANLFQLEDSTKLINKKANTVFEKNKDLYQLLLKKIKQLNNDNKYISFDYFITSTNKWLRISIEELDKNHYTIILEDISEYHKINATNQNEDYLIIELENTKRSRNEIEKVAQMGSWEYHIEIGKLTWSDVLFEIFEIDKSKIEPSYEIFINSVHPEDREFVEKTYTELLKNRTKYNIEYRLLFYDGRIKYVREICDTFYDDIGKPIRYVGILKDITEKKLKEKIITQLSLAVKQSSSMILMTDLDGKIEYVNDKFTEITGYTLDEIKGKTPRILKSGKHSKEFYNELWETIKSGKVWSGEIFNKKKNGDYYWESEKIYPVFDEKGKITNFVAIKDDITQQKLIQQKLEESEQNFFNIFHNSGIPMLIIYKEKFIEVNEAAYKLLGYEDASGLINKHPVELSPEYQPNNILSLEKAEKMLEIAYSKGYHRFEWIHKKANDELVYFDVSLTHIIYKGKSVLFCVWYDLTDKKNAEKEIIEAKKKAEENENRLLTFINSIPDIVCYKDGDGRWLLANQADLELFQLNNVNYFGLTDAQLADYTHEMYREAFKTCMISDEIAWKQGTISKGIEKIPTIDGGYKIYDVYKIPVFNEDGSRNGLAVIGRDITELIKTQEELIKAKEKAEESDKLKSAFLANMSHEIRTPLNGIIGFTDLLLLPNISEQKRIEYLTMIKKSGLRLLNIINDLIDISKLEAGMVTVNLSEISINEVLDYIYIFFKPETDAKGLSLFVNNKLQNNFTNFLSDKEKIYAILINLVKNAIKFTQIGSIEIGVSFDNDSLKFYVKDTGVGIPEDRLDKIFERFVQVDDHKEINKQGAGLGLAIVKAYVNMLGGKIWVESKVGVGSTFYFIIPIDPAQNKNIDEKNTTEVNTNQNANLSILIVEDDEISSILLESSLKKITHSIYKVNNGEDAIHFIENDSSIDVILMDMGLPKLNGYDATREIRKFNKEIVIIAQSAYALSNEQDKAIEAGCNYFLPKPIDISELYNLLNKYFPNKVKKDKL